ncbi:MAG: surface-adhesin E family protein [Polaromonas sp.]|uniref:surface-adhesin E family protein n=1 Tax=Polaromonas sp. TaxID=1869339 RepID=UPI00326428A2
MFHTVYLGAKARHAGATLGMVAAIGLSAAAYAAETWLTLAGDPADPGAHYVQVNPAAIDLQGDLRIIPVRINRARLWTFRDSVQFRSVETDVRIDCVRHTADYVKAAFYAQPDFRGTPFKLASYAADGAHPMEFEDMADNPTARIIKAACSARSVISN